MSPMVWHLFYFQEVKKADMSLEDEWLSFEKMISDQPISQADDQAGDPTNDQLQGQTNSSGGSSQYLVQGMVAYPGMSSQMVPKQVSAAPKVKDEKHSDGKDVQIMTSVLLWYQCLIH